MPDLASSRNHAFRMFFFQDNNWFRDILVVDGNWERKIDGVRVRVHYSCNLAYSNEVENIGVCRPKLIYHEMQILVVHSNWKWLLSPGCFINRGKDPAINHYSKYLILSADSVFWPKKVEVTQQLLLLTLVVPSQPQLLIRDTMPECLKEEEGVFLRKKKKRIAFPASTILRTSPS